MRLLFVWRAANYKRIRLGTNKKLRESHKFYAKLGFYQNPPYEDEATENAYFKF